MQAEPWYTDPSLYISALALLFSGISLVLTYNRDQREKDRDVKKLRIRSVSTPGLMIGDHVSEELRCSVINVGGPPVEIAGVGIASSPNTGVHLTLTRASNTHSGVLEQGQSQDWVTSMSALEDLKQNDPSLTLLAIATDKEGDMYYQDEKDAIAIQLHR